MKLVNTALYTGNITNDEAVLRNAYKNIKLSKGDGIHVNGKPNE